METTEDIFPGPVAPSLPRGLAVLLLSSLASAAAYVVTDKICRKWLW